MAREYSDSPKLAHDPDKGGVKVERSKMTEDSGKTPGDQPEGGNTPNMVSEHHARHERERKEMIERHSTEMADMHARHLDEHKKVLGRQSKELSTASAPVPVEAKKVDGGSDTGDAKKPSGEKSEGKGGTEP